MWPAKVQAGAEEYQVRGIREDCLVPVVVAGVCWDSNKMFEVLTKEDYLKVERESINERSVARNYELDRRLRSVPTKASKASSDIVSLVTTEISLGCPHQIEENMQTE